MKPVAYEGKEKYIFISYAHKDSEKVFRIMSALQAEGYRIWYDDGIIPGSEWPENIAMHLNDAAMVIAMISPSSMASHNCRREINFALSKQKPFLSVILEPTEMSLGMEMQLSAQNIVMRQNYNRWEDFISKIMLCPGLEPCRIVDEEERKQYRPRGMQMESEADHFVYGASATEEPKKKKRSPLVVICGILAVCVVALAVMMFGGKGQGDTDNEMDEVITTPENVIPENEVLPVPDGELIAEGKWASGELHVYAIDDRNYEILLTDYLISNGYTTSETPGKREPYWNIGLSFGLSDVFSVHVRGVTSDVFSISSDYMQRNATYNYPTVADIDRQENTLVVKIELPEEVTWNTKDIGSVYVNLGTEDISMTDHYDFWRS